jgi:lipopolysaccharide assembly LptE-like protein
MCRSAAILLSLLLAGCESGGHFSLFGYTTKPPFDPCIRSVYVPMAQNFSYRKDLEFDLTKQVNNELTMRAGAPRVTSDRERADSELLLKIVNVRKGTVLINQAGETRDSELQVQVEVIWRDLRPGRVGDVLSMRQRYDPEIKPLPGEVLPPPPVAIPIIIAPTSMFIPELGGSFAASERQTTLRAAQQIVNMMERTPSR